MQKHSDEALIAYLDGELDSAERGHVEAWMEADPAARARLAALAQADDLVRDAYASILEEPIPERLIAATRGEGAATAGTAAAAEILVLRPGRPATSGSQRRWHIGLAAAATLFGLVVGSTGTYFGASFLPGSPAAERHIADATANSVWLDNAAGYYKLTAAAGDGMLIDVPASNDTGLQKISQDLAQPVHPPDLKPSWGLTFRGARLVVVEGRPAAELVYTADNQSVGPLTLVVGTTKLPDIGLTVDRQQDVNLVYWRHHGRAYALAGRTDPGYLWNIANDIAWKLDAV